MNQRGACGSLGIVVVVLAIEGNGVEVGCFTICITQRPGTRCWSGEEGLVFISSLEHVARLVVAYPV
jgi:hypothetical protein